MTDTQIPNIPFQAYDSETDYDYDIKGLIENEIQEPPTHEADYEAV